MSNAYKFDDPDGCYFITYSYYLLLIDQRRKVKAVTEALAG